MARSRTIEVFRNCKVVLTIEEFGDSCVKVLVGDKIIGLLLLQVHVVEILCDSNVVLGLLKELKKSWVTAHVLVFCLSNIVFCLLQEFCHRHIVGLGQELCDADIVLHLLQLLMNRCSGLHELRHCNVIRCLVQEFSDSGIKEFCY